MISSEEKISLLRNVSSFRDLEEDQLSELANLCREKKFSSGDVVFQQGDKGGEIYIVVDGKLAIEREIGNKRDNDIKLTVNRLRNFSG